MSKVMILGSATAVAFVIGALSAVGASALPSYFHCVKIEFSSSKFSSEKNCELLTAGTGEWEFKELVSGEKLQLPGTGGTATLETVKKNVIQCASSKSSGETNGPQTSIKIIITFEKCLGPANSECQSAGAAKEVIITKPLSGTLGYIKKTAPIEVGILLEPETAGALDVEFKCVGFLGFESTLKVRGSLICKVTPINSMTTKGKIECSETAGKQAFTKFEGEVGSHTLETEAKGTVEFPFEQSGQISTQTLTTSNDELKA